MNKITTYFPHIQAFMQFFFIIFVIWNRFKHRQPSTAAKRAPAHRASTSPARAPGDQDRTPGHRQRTHRHRPAAGARQARPTDTHGQRHGARAGRRGGATHTTPKAQECILIAPLDAKKMMVYFFVKTLPYSHFYSQFSISVYSDNGARGENAIQKLAFGIKQKTYHGERR